MSIANGEPSKLSLVRNYIANRPTFSEEFDDLSAKYKQLNFGIGYPDYITSETLQNALAKAAVSDNYELSQFSSTAGHPRLLKAISEFHSKLLNQRLIPDENFVITVGASEALFAIFQAHTVPGDEWIVFEPYYPKFVSMIKAAHGVPRYIPLIPDKTTGKITSTDFKFDREDLANLFNEKTKGIVINTPHNPTGKVFDYEELTYIAELAKKWDVIVVFNEVYQFMIFNGAEHLRLAKFPGMFKRTITVGSAGKMFGITGYRIGWAYGPENLIKNIKTVSEVAVVSVSTPCQEAVAVAIEEEMKNYGKPYAFIAKFRKETESKRNRIYNILMDAGMRPIFSESGYFIVANWTTMVDRIQMSNETDEYADYAFVKWLMKNAKTFVYPLSSAYGESNMHMGQDYVRFTMVKRDKTLDELERLLKKWKSERRQMMDKIKSS